MTTEEILLQTVASLTKTNEEQGRQIAELTAELKKMSAQIAWFQRQMFGRRSERHIAIDSQPGLFDDLETEASSDTGEVPETEEETMTYTRKKGRKGTSGVRETWENLPVLETRTIEPEGIDLSRYRRMGEEVTYLVGFEPGKYYRIAVVRPKYGLIDPTEPVERGKGVLIAPLPKFPIYKGVPDASLLTEIELQKYGYHMPFYRQIRQMAHLGMKGLKEATLVGWHRRTMELLRPLYDLLVSEVFRSDYVQTDESTVPVIDHEKGQAEKEYLWMSRAVMERLVVFFYDEGSRSGDVVKARTDRYNFRGYMQCDGFGGYTAAYRSSADMRLVHCMVHIRREWEKALDENRKAASWFLGRIRGLYRIEHECDRDGVDFAGRRDVRQSRSKPIMEEMRKWLETEGLRYSQSSLTGNIRLYTLGGHDACA